MFKRLWWITQGIMLWALGIAFFYFAATGLHCAWGTDYKAPDIDDYYDSLFQPDHPETPCCGWGDAYWADRTEECVPGDGPDCALVAIITDTRPDNRVLPNGLPLKREHYDVGTRVVIPRSKLRKHALPNPTEHNLLFFADNKYDHIRNVYCWEPIGLF